MPDRKIQTPDGAEIIVRDVAFEPVEEPWSLYRLKDGGNVKVRATALFISRILDADGRPTTLPDGQPGVYVQAQTQIVASEGD